jgi:hypothetical protein
MTPNNQESEVEIQPSDIELEKAHQKKLKAARAKLNLQQIDFCNLYMSEEYYGNGKQSYIVAYKVNMARPGAGNMAGANAARLLAKDSILDYVNLMIDGSGLNDAFVDQQMLFLVKQNGDLGVKRSMIADYLKMKGRIKGEGTTVNNLMIQVKQYVQ